MKDILYHHFKMGFLSNNSNSSEGMWTLQFRKINPEHDVNAVVMVIILLLELMIACGIIVVHKRRFGQHR